MSFTAWMAVGGALLLTMAMSSALIQRLPVSTAAIYLGVGCAIGPWGFDVLRIDLNDNAPWIERLTEIAVILSLFIGGLRLRLPLQHLAWRAAFRLASVVMVASIAGTALCAWLLLDMDPRAGAAAGRDPRAHRPCARQNCPRRSFARQRSPALCIVRRSRAQ